MSTAVVIALWILAYLVTGVIILKIATTMQPFEEDDDVDTIMAVVILAWPILAVAIIAVTIWDTVKRFVQWDTKTWRTARKAQRIERELQQKTED